MSKGSAPTTLLEGYQEKLSGWTQLEPDPEIWKLMTKRERQAFIGVCEGLSDKQIAFRHEIAPNTVKVHLRHLRKRIGAYSRVGLVTKICRLKAPSQLGAYSQSIISRETEQAA